MSECPKLPVTCISEEICLGCPDMELDVTRMVLSGFESATQLYENHICCVNYGKCRRLIDMYQKEVVKK